MTDLLPSNATALERELATASAPIDTIDVSVIETLWDPALCPASLLPHLAWAMSVDIWDDAWEESRQRAVIAQSRAYHEIKGTREAVDRLLRSLGCRTVIREWWQTTPPGRRGTIEVVAYVVERMPPHIAAITPERIRQTFDAVLRAKPKSRAMRFVLAIATLGKVGLAAAHQSAVLRRANMGLDVDTTTQASAGLVAAHQSASLTTASAGLTADTAITARAVLLARAHGAALTHGSARLDIDTNTHARLCIKTAVASTSLTHVSVRFE